MRAVKGGVSAGVAGGDAVPVGTVPVGTVEDVRRIDAGDGATGVESWVLAVGTPEGELLIPLAAEICTRIDTEARRIEVRLPEGLRGLNA